ncbi:hypothetical protein [Corynebacterium maris]|uniref:hypothetical protein n=1 Tax=Corynebacterium maris TaxID=575200 RepID=UPI00040F38D2|nr:hypothetical protein [Corynebacterium maris]
MLFKTANFVSIETSASGIEGTHLTETGDLTSFEILTAAGIGSGPEITFDMTLGMSDLTGITVPELSECVGEWMAVAERSTPRSNDYLVFADPYGYCPVFYAIVPGRAIILSDSFYGARAGLVEWGVDPTLDFENYLTTVSAKSVHFANPSVHRTMAREIKILSLDKALLITKETIRTISRNVLEKASSIDNFEEAIARGVSYATDSLKNIFRTYDLDKTLFLSGGVDSRLLLALCLKAGIKDDVQIRTADPRKFATKYSRTVIRNDVRISNAIRQDLKMSWWRKSESSNFAVDFRESLASFQSYRSNFSYAYSPQNSVNIATSPVIALRGGGGEMLRSTNTSIRISQKIHSLESSGEVEGDSNVDKLLSWYMQTGRLTGLFDDTIAGFMTEVFESLGPGSIIEMMNMHYLKTRNRTHFGHARFSHVGNEVAFHFLSNAYFRRAAELCSFEDRSEGLVVNEIFKQTAPELLQYPFENDDWTQKLTAEPRHWISEDDRLWQRELDALQEVEPERLQADGWGRADRGIGFEPISQEKQADFIRRCFSLVESHVCQDKLPELSVFHQRLFAVVNKQPQHLATLVSKVASAADVFFPTVRKGKSTILSCFTVQREVKPVIRSSKPSVLEVPQDGWNNIPLVNFSPIAVQCSGGIMISSQVAGALSAGTQFAYYLYKDGERIGMEWYSSRPQMLFEMDLEPGLYHSKVFARSGLKDSPITKDTPMIKI